MIQDPLISGDPRQVNCVGFTDKSQTKTVAEWTWHLQIRLGLPNLLPNTVLF